MKPNLAIVNGGTTLYIYINDGGPIIPLEHGEAIDKSELLKKLVDFSLVKDCRTLKVVGEYDIWWPRKEWETDFKQLV